MKVLAFSDVHRDLEACAALVERSNGVDMVVGAGDFASVHEGLEETLGALSGMRAGFVAVPGNNETEEALREAAPEVPVSILHGDSGSVAGTLTQDEPESLSIWGLGAGIPTTPWDWSFDLSEEEAAEKLKAMPEGLDLLILHSPPYGHCDTSGGGDHLGSQAILEAIEQKQPQVAVCGHIHESWGAESTIGETRVFNLGPAGRVIEIEAA
jgi:uncharacterized protein